MILLDTEAVNRSIYEDAISSILRTNDQSGYRARYRRHILVQRDKAVEFLRRIQAYLTSREVHPDIQLERLEEQLNVKAAQQLIADDKAKREQEERDWKQSVIDGPNRYIKHYSFSRKLYSMVDDQLTTNLTADSESFARPFGLVHPKGSWRM